jgi:hypothetical protein
MSEKPNAADDLSSSIFKFGGAVGLLKWVACVEKIVSTDGATSYNTDNALATCPKDLFVVELIKYFPFHNVPMMRFLI